MWPPGISWIKMGPGVIGTTSYVAVAVLLVAAVLAWTFESDEYRLILLVTVVAFGGFYLRSAFKFGDKHPHYAALSSADVVQMRRIEHAAKDGKIIDHDATNSANIAPPAAISGGDGKASSTLPR